MGTTASNLNDNLGVLTTDQQAVVSFESNANPNLTPANPSFNTYLGNGAEIVTPQGQLQAGATITYSFSPGSFTVAQQADIEQAMAVWSGVCNVKFVYQPSYNADPGTGLSTTAQLSLIDINNNPNGEYDETTNAIATAQPSVYRSAQEAVYIDQGGNYGTLGDYATGGFGQGAVLHELGHVLGLGHTGNYNGGTTAETDAGQLNAYDSRAWSVMSYVDPADTGAKYYAGSATPGAYYAGNAGTVPMGLDIYAVQRLYGAPTSTMFAGGQVFGFNSNITYTTPAGTTAKVAMFDFSVDTNPIVTLYDYGTGNTLDLSGFSSNDTVNLNAGSFSSVNGYTDNIFIEYGTAIDSLVAGTGNDVITVNAQADKITGGAGSDTVVFANPYADYSFSRTGNALDVTGSGVTDTLSNVTTLQFSDKSVAASSLACFAAGTRILTTRGEVAVEALAGGDDVILADGGTAPISWIGHRRIDLTRHPRPETVLPVLIEAGAVAEGVPCRDVLVSPDHALYLDGHLIPAKALLNGATIRQVERRDITYYHVELDHHAVILAEGAPAETYLESGNRAAFADGSAPVALYPDFAQTLHEAQALREAEGCAPFAESGTVVEAVRARILGRAAIPTTGNPALTIHYHDGASIIESRSTIPGHTSPDPRDRRTLGVKIARIAIDGEEIPLDHPSLTEGWHDAEPDGRWTTGRAMIPAGLLQGRTVAVSLAATLRYPADPVKAGRRA